MSEQASIPAETRIGHVHLKVADLDRSIRFYRDLLGFDLMTRLGGQAAFLSAGGYHHHIGLNTWGTRGGPAPPPGARGLGHFEVVLPDREELERVRARIADAGLTARPDERGVLVADPSGNTLLLRVNGE